MRARNFLGEGWRGSREIGDRFSMKEAAKARPFSEGGPGTSNPGKRMWILILLSAIPWAFEFFGQDIDQVSRLRFGKFISIFKKLSIFQKSDRVETGLDPLLEDELMPITLRL